MEQTATRHRQPGGTIGLYTVTHGAGSVQFYELLLLSWSHGLPPAVPLSWPLAPYTHTLLRSQGTTAIAHHVPPGYERLRYLATAPVQC